MNGDLVYKLYLETPQSEEFNASTHSFSNPGHSMIDFIELEIGGQTIDTIYGHWMEVWSRLTQPNELGVVGLLDNNNHNIFSSISVDGASNTVSMEIQMVVNNIVLMMIIIR